jgi:hypothetical protein
MKPALQARHWAGVSVLVNVCLLLASFRLSRPLPGSATSAPAADSSEATPAAVQFVTNAETRAVTVTNVAPPFRWSQVQTQELRIYAANLRAMDCPAKVIHDVIRGELAELYLERRHALLEPYQKQYWEPATHTSSQLRDTLRKQIQQLREQTLEQLPKIIAAPEESKPALAQPARQPMLDFLPEDKATQMAELLAQRQKQVEELGKQRKPGKEQEAARKELDRQHETAVQALLSPDEYTEYRLRQSRFAQVGSGLTGMEMNEEELKTLARIHEQFPLAAESINRKDPAKVAEQEEAQRQRQEAIKNWLGEERFAEYQQARDPGYEELYRVTERYELPRETAQAADELRKSALLAAKQIQEISSLSMEERQAFLQQIQQETRRQLQQTLGARAGATYEKHFGAWLERMPDEQK